MVMVTLILQLHPLTPQHGILNLHGFRHLLQPVAGVVDILFHPMLKIRLLLAPITVLGEEIIVTLMAVGVAGHSIIRQGDYL
jgi:hypothetical protein